MSMQTVKVRSQTSRSQGSKQFAPIWVFTDFKHQFEFTDGYEMMYKTGINIEGVP